MSAATAGVSSVDGGTKTNPPKSESGTLIVALQASAHKEISLSALKIIKHILKNRNKIRLI